MTRFLLSVRVSSWLVSSLLATSSSAQIREVARLAPEGLSEGDRFGLVALRGDRALVGSPFVSSRGPDSGAAFLFERSPRGGWALVAKLQGSQIKEGSFFGSVAIEGNLAVVGAPGDDDLGLFTGAVYVFERVRGEWRESARLLADDGHAVQGFGVRVAISGERILVGASGDHEHGFNAGAAYIYERDAAGRWMQVVKLVAADAGSSDYFGSALALDRDRALIGTQSDEAAQASGAAYVFERQLDGSWLQITKLASPLPTRQDYFGSAVALSGDRALVGAYLDDSAGYGTGAAYLFQRDAAGRWREIEKLTASDAAPRSDFGQSLALDGGRALIAAPRADGAFLDTGAVYVFEPVTRRHVPAR